MLHILSMLLKFILIVLGILLGLLLLAVLLILFCPVRYRASVLKTEGGLKQIEGNGNVSWLFHGVSLKAEWKYQQLDLAFYLFGIPVSKLLKKRQERKTKPKKTSAAGKRPVTKKSAPSEKEIIDERPTIPKKPTTPEPVVIEKPAYPEKIESVSEKHSEQKNSFIKKIYDRLRNIFKSVCVKFRNIKGTVSRIKNQASWWRAFLEHPRVKAAGKLVWKHAKFLLRHLFPTRLEGQVTFSFANPALTGTALAVLGMTIPFHKNCVQINPRFDGEDYLYGNIRAKGRIYGFVLIRAVVSIYFNKNIKYAIKRWKTRRA